MKAQGSHSGRDFFMRLVVASILVVCFVWGALIVYQMHSEFKEAEILLAEVKVESQKFIDDIKEYPLIVTAKEDKDVIFWAVADVALQEALTRDILNWDFITIKYKKKQVVRFYQMMEDRRWFIKEYVKLILKRHFLPV